MSSSSARHPKVGKLRPTQIVSQHGPGAIVDLPELSVVIAGIDEWKVKGSDRIIEPRLEAFLKASSLFRPPRPSPAAFGGVPAYVFPEWLVCPVGKCRLLAPKESFQWVGPPVGEFRCPRDDRHSGKTRVSAFPARFMTACPKGHLDDFPWHRWVHVEDEGHCSGPLRLDDEGRSGSVNDLVVSCERCDANRRMGGVFERGKLQDCSGRRPWLGPSDYEAACGEDPRVVLRGASNAYFSVTASALSIPPYSDPIQMAIAPYLDTLVKLSTVDRIEQAAELDLLGDLLLNYSPEELLAAARGEVTEIERLRPDEYRAFLDPPEPAQPPHEFEVRRIDTPSGTEAGKLATVRAATRLREVRALRGFTRIEAGIDVGDLADVAKLDIDVAPLGPKNVTWRPAVELRGEGIFLSLDEQALNRWEERPEIASRARELSVKFDEHQAGRSDDATQWRPFPGMRYILLHTLAHALIRRLCLDAGYSSSALRERIYSASGDDPMAGLLIYTASSDSEGSLGGLVDQAKPDRFGAVLVEALQDAQLCAQDPLCGADELSGAVGLNGAACHACLLLAETSCEASNRFLDRAVLVETLGRFGRWYFRGA
ncbi:DrmB family protein [Candidatus Poriferisodalis sp.]|uniref:DrmB family protein n=1 Tax=Candidatus Poriferisodalis sp. TaxID=3101277 RepID=UPI003D1089A4